MMTGNWAPFVAFLYWPLLAAFPKAGLDDPSRHLLFRPGPVAFPFWVRSTPYSFALRSTTSLKPLLALSLAEGRNKIKFCTALLIIAVKI
jgi:hypothetical protein